MKGDCMLIVGHKNNPTIYFGSLAGEEVGVVLLCSRVRWVLECVTVFKTRAMVSPKDSNSYTTVPNRVPNEDKPGGDPANPIPSDHYNAWYFRIGPCTDFVLVQVIGGRGERLLKE